MMNSKHKKIKNTGLLYEMLIQQMTSEVISNEVPKSLNLIKKHFHNTELAKEYKLYKTLSETTGKSENEASLILNEAISYYNKLDKSKINKDKYNLVKDINNNYPNFFKQRVPNYSLNASIYNILESQNEDKGYDITEIVKNKVTLLEHFTKKDEKDEFLEEYNKLDKLTKKIAYKVAIDKFNEKYKSVLNENQKSIMIDYITESLTPDKIKNNLDNIIKLCESKLKLVKDETTSKKLQEVINDIDSFKNNINLSEDTINKVLMYNDLYEELKTNLS